MIETGGRSGTLIGVVTVVLSLAWGMATAQDELTVECDLVGVEWEFRAWGRTSNGIACLLRPSGDLLRVEISREAESVEGLKAQRGRGWTVSLAGGGEVTLNEWHREWRRLDPEMVTGVQVLAAACSGGRSVALDAALAAGVGTSDNSTLVHERSWYARWIWRKPARVKLDVTLPSGTKPARATLHRRLVERGRGRGADCEVWSFVWDDDGTFSVCSSRRSGTLRLRETSRQLVCLPLPEGILPLWTLATLICDLENGH